MSEVSKICITEKFGNKMITVSSVKVLSNKGIVKDRYFKENNDKDLQITLIELENINYFNKKSKTNIPYIDFRRNIITRGIELNKLVGKELLIGKVKIKVHRLCDPCKYLQDKLKKNNSFKSLANLYNRGGLRCEILLDGIIYLKDKITIL